MARRKGFYVVRWIDDPGKLQYWGGIRWEDDEGEAVVYPTHEQAAWRASKQERDGGTIQVAKVT